MIRLFDDHSGPKQWLSAKKALQQDIVLYSNKEHTSTGPPMYGEEAINPL